THPPTKLPPMHSATQAAPWMWAFAGVVLLFSCCCGFSATMFGLIDQATINQAIDQYDMPPDQANFMRNKTAVAAVFGTFAGLGLITAIAVAVLAFQVRAANPAAITVSRILLIGAAVGLGFLTLLSVVQAVLALNPIQLISALLSTGLPAALAAVATIILFKPVTPRFAAPRPTPGPGQPAPPAPDLDDEPWNSHLR
ncbi:MAG: hypothetical protein AAF078_13730, partial [Planctomycetota bacterium]